MSFRTEVVVDVPVCTMRLPGGFTRAEARWRDLTASSTAVAPGEELSARGRANDDFEQVELVDAAGTVISFDRRYRRATAQSEPEPLVGLHVERTPIATGRVKVEAEYRGLTAGAIVRHDAYCAARILTTETFDQVEIVDEEDFPISFARQELAFDGQEPEPEPEPEPAADEIITRIDAKLTERQAAEGVWLELPSSSIASIADAYNRGELADQRVYLNLTLRGGWLTIPKGLDP